MSSEPSLPPTRLYRVSPADAVVLREIIDDRLGILRRDRSAEDVGHFVYLGLPSLAIEKPQIGTQIVEAVAGAAVAFDRLPPGGLCEKYGFSSARALAAAIRTRTSQMSAAFMTLAL